MLDAKRLLEWFESAKRDLPWRATPSPYWTWISEVMSQQTTLAVVVPYFERFVSELSDVQALAAAPEPTLRKLWQGLGYYSRVRSLQKAARIIVDERQGELPTSYEDWLSMPGCGPYTAAAIASISAGERVAAVDGNVLRVVSRLRLIGDEIHRTAARQSIASDLSNLMVNLSPGDFNQALMELGATICKPRNPICMECPIRESCEAFLKGLTQSYPPARVRRSVERHVVTAVVAQCPSTDAYLVVERGSGLLSQTSGFALLRKNEWEEYSAKFSMDHAPWKGRHQITHHALELRFVQASFSSHAEFAQFRTWIGALSSVKSTLLVGAQDLSMSLTSSLDRKIALAAGAMPRERLARPVHRKN